MADLHGKITPPVNIRVRLAESGPKGEPFRYEDFTPAQLEALKGPKVYFSDIDIDTIRLYIGEEFYDFIKKESYVEQIKLLQDEIDELKGRFL